MTISLYIPTIFGVSVEVYFFLLIIGIPTFFIWRWLLMKFIKADKKRKIAVWAATIITTPLIYIGIILLWIFSISYYPNRDFDKEKWSANKEKRYELSKNLIEGEILIGKSKTEVRQILGDAGNSDESNYWSYYLGFIPGPFNIDPSVLDIEFKDGKVIKVRQHET
jgi:hypothetical protein